MDNKKISQKELAKISIFLERNVMLENVGYQDQIAASYGGFNNIKFSKNNFKINKILCSKNFKKKMNENLYLVYTGKARTAEKIVKTFVSSLSTKRKKNINQILNYVIQAKKIIRNNNADDFGHLLNETWLQKRELSKSISTNKIDLIYEQGINNGALGGKLLGAGGGGFIMFYVNKVNKDKFIKSLNKNVVVPIKLSTTGSEVIFNEK